MRGDLMREWLLIGLVIISVPLVLRRPLWGMIIYISATIIRPEMLFWGGTGGSYVFKVYYMLILAGMFLRHDFKKIGQVARWEFLLMLWMMGAIFLSEVVAQYPVFRGSYYVEELLKGFGICALLYMLIKDFEEIKTVQNVLLGCFAFLSVWGFDQQLRGNERLEGLGGGAWGDSNGVAAIFILFLPVALARAFASKNRRQFWTFLGIAALMVALIVCTKSRAGLLGLVTCLVIFGFCSRITVKLAQVVLVLMFAAMPFATKQYVERMETMSSTGDIENSASDRITLWKLGLIVFADNPVIGTGFLTYPEAKMKYEDQFLYLDEEFRNSIFRNESKKVTHNTYIQLLSDCGLLGAVPFILLVGVGILRGLQARRLLSVIPEKNAELICLSGISAGVSGYAVCILSIDAVLDIQFYFQLVFASILYAKIREGAKKESVAVFTSGTSLAAEGASS